MPMIGLMPRARRLLVELDGAVEGAVVGHGDRFLAQLLRPVHQLRDAESPSRRENSVWR